MAIIHCDECGRPVTADGTQPSDYFACTACEQRYGPALLKAASDPFNYACRLVTGETIRFSEARLTGDWVHLRGDPQGTGNADQPVDGLPYPCPRGVDVRVEHIVWVADAPEGT